MNGLQRSGPKAHLKTIIKQFQASGSIFVSFSYSNFLWGRSLILVELNTWASFLSLLLRTQLFWLPRNLYFSKPFSLYFSKSFSGWFFLHSNCLVMQNLEKTVESPFNLWEDRPHYKGTTFNVPSTFQYSIKAEHDISILCTTYNNTC